MKPMDVAQMIIGTTMVFVFAVIVLALATANGQPLLHPSDPYDAARWFFAGLGAVTFGPWVILQLRRDRKTPAVSRSVS